MDLAKFTFIVTCCLFALVGAFGAGLAVARYELPPFALIQRVKADIASLIEEPLTEPSHHLQPARGAGEGITINARPDDGALILVSGLFNNGNELRLIGRDGTIKARWPVSFSELFSDPEHLETPPQTDWNVDIHGALIEPDGSVVFNFEYAGLVKLGRCGNVDWTLAHPTHHSVEKANDGGYWVPGRRTIPDGETAYPPFPTPYSEDLILKISSSGEIKRVISVPDILYTGGLKALMTASTENFDQVFLEERWDRELVHVNKVAELASDWSEKFPLFDEGDLLISIRELNLVMVIDENSLDIKWHQVGPWLRQHDPEFDRNGTIVLFNNNIFSNSLLPSGKSRPATPRVSSVVRTDPHSGITVTEYGGDPSHNMLSVIRGKVDLVPDGGFLITEFEGGRAIEVNEDGSVVWEYINRYDEGRVAEITEARLYQKDYFAVHDWRCK